MRHCLKRDGFGLILAVTTLFLLTWGIAGIALMTFSGSVTDTVHTATTGAMGLAFAQSAIEEAFHQVSRRVNQPGDPLFAAMREEYLDRDRAFKTFSIRPDNTLRAMAEDPLYKGYSLAGNAVQVSIVAIRPLTHLTYESKGTLAFTARVGHGRVVRAVRQTRGFKVALASTPRPFDQVTWLLRHPEPLYGSRAEANSNIDRSVQAVRDLEEERSRFAGQIRDLLPILNQEVDDANELVDEAADAGYDPGVRAERWFAEESEQHLLDAALSQAPEFRGEDVTAPYHKFPRDLILYSVAPELPSLTENHYLPPKVRAQNEAIEAARARYDAAQDELIERYNESVAKLEEVRKFRESARSMGPSKALSQGRRLCNESNQLRRLFSAACQEYAEAAEDYSREHEKRWDIYVTFLRSFQKLSGARAREIAGYDPKFDVAGSATSQLGRAFIRFTGPKAGERFQRFLAEQPAGRPVNAIVFVDNGREPLRLERLSIHGKLDLSVTGPIELEDVSLRDSVNDLFTVHAGAGQQVRISGWVQASVLAAGPVDLASGALLEGNLVQRELQMPDRLTGSIKRDARYFSGISSTDNQRLDHFIVALSPIAGTTTIARR